MREMSEEEWSALSTVLSRSLPQRCFLDGKINQDGLELWFKGMLEQLQTDVCWSFLRAFGYDGALRMNLSD